MKTRELKTCTAFIENTEVPDKVNVELGENHAVASEISRLVSLGSGHEFDERVVNSQVVVNVLQFEPDALGDGHDVHTK